MADTTPPVLDSISFSTTSLNVGAGQTTLLVTAHFTDDLSGIFDGTFANGMSSSPPQILFRSPSGQLVYGMFDILHPVSGGRLDGVYQASVTLGSNAEAGVWQVQSLLLNDEAGNSVYLSPTNSAALAAASSFTVTNGLSDTTPPVLDLISFSTTSLNVGAGQTTLLVTAHFTDDLSGIFDGTFANGMSSSPPQILFRSPSGQLVYGMFDILHPVSGGRLDGVYQASVTLGSNAEAGVWQVQSLLLNDEAGNSVYLSPTNSPALAAASSFTVTNGNQQPAANVAPTITSNGGGDAAAVSIVENTTAVTTVTATDPDVGQTLSYSIIGGADASKFTIGSSTGALSFVTAPNFELPTDAGGNNVYDVIVQASDGHGGIDSQAIAVTVTDVFENSPPTIAGTASGQTTTSEAPVKPFAHVLVGDSNYGATDTLTITLGGAGGTLTDGTGFSNLTPAGAGVYRLSGTAAAITSEVDALVFTPKAGAPNTSSTTTFTLSDQSSAGGAPVVDATTTVINKDIVYPSDMANFKLNIGRGHRGGWCGRRHGLCDGGDAERGRQPDRRRGDGCSGVGWQRHVSH